MLSKVIFSEKPILSFDINNNENEIIAISEKNVYRYELLSGNLVMKKELFTKNGLSRKVLCDDKLIYCKDFCTFYVLDYNSLNVIFKSELGTNLSSDICGLDFDDTNIYASIRGGGLAIINKENYDIKKLTISSNSLWNVKSDTEYIYGGAVNGTFFVINKKTLEIVACLDGHKENCDDFIICEDFIITSSKDKLIKRNKKTFDIIQQVKKPHKYQFSIIDFWNDYFITAAFRDGIIRIWDTKSMEILRDVNIINCLTGYAKIENNLLYLSSRAINGIDRVNLTKLLDL
ncbi:hypothetical protein [Proteiniborus sp. MB09-C3]|uniref:hypothetical protein n=1 Tax=Proteiniborus sp. MB09-C3 TaxID=3050072 RepID=UPI002553FDD1|nr:hypothetical protein [Proteiniborus sp. MB09-C3]WIV10566.1 hypothetical protein QO263_10395 [Proteiniborus sp. MB09-C3]